MPQAVVGFARIPGSAQGILANPTTKTSWQNTKNFHCKNLRRSAPSYFDPHVGQSEMHKLSIAFLVLVPLSLARGDQTLLNLHCSKCHSGAKPKGGFHLNALGKAVNAKNAELWTNSLDYVRAGEMPPARQSRLSMKDRERLVQFLQKQSQAYDGQAHKSRRLPPRRLNNRELANSVADVLLIEDVGTHEPLANLLGDTLQDGFDTNGDALGLSEFHLEQYVNAFRRIVDAVILSGEQPPTRRIKVAPADLRISELSNRRRAERANRTAKSIEILDMRKHAYFANFETVPQSGRYRLTIRAAGIDRRVYDSEQTGHYEDDPIRLRVHLGDRTRDFDLPDEKTAELKLDEWLAAGTRIRVTYLTDALRLKGNGNFKFQYQIAHDHIKKNDPELYAKVAANKQANRRKNAKQLSHWSFWTEYWQGPRPRLFGAEIEGPIYASWPPKRQLALLGENPQAANAAAILRPIAARAWRRDVRDGELDSIVRLVQTRALAIGDLEALKEGVVAILASPSFLLLNPETARPADRFAAKWSYFLHSTTPSEKLRQMVQAGKLQTFEAVRDELRRQWSQGQADEFLREFPQAWLQLDRINFMAPDPDRFPLYHRKRLSEDMVGEVLHFFRHAVDNNVPVPELLTADYSFINADLAKVYGIENAPRDSQFRRHTFTDQRRGGLLGMAAFLTLTADSLGTSPIHRAVYVMENFLGIHPPPPPGDIEISEPDVRQAKTIKEILNAHRADENCASCHRSIDPYGYAFENFDPVGAWREAYTAHLTGASRREHKKPIPIDAAAEFRNGAAYRDIREFRQLMRGDSVRDRFVRCFITKLLTYANGESPHDYSEIEKIAAKSAKHDYRMIETIAAVIDSPLFREE